MSKKYENIVKKEKGKIKKRVKIPQTIDNYITNLLIDLKNYNKRMNFLDEDINKLKRYGWQINHNIEQILQILKDNSIYKSVMEKEKI